VRGLEGGTAPDDSREAPPSGPQTRKAILEAQATRKVIVEAKINRKKEAKEKLLQLNPPPATLNKKMISNFLMTSC